MALFVLLFFFFFNDPAPTEIYPLSLPDALPISNSDVRIGQYTELGASLSTPSSRTSPTTPTISRQSSLGLTRICLPSALAGSCQYSRAILSETIATGTLL